MLLRSFLAIGLMAALAAPTTQADTGGAALPSNDQVLSPQHPAPGSGGHRYRTPDRRRPVLSKLGLSGRSLFALGRPIRVSFAIRDRSPSVRVSLSFIRVGAGKPVYRVSLGRLTTRKTHVFRWRGTENATKLTPGRYRVRISALDNAGNTLRRQGLVAKAGTIEYRDHRFPVAGPHSFGGSDARFGAERTGHTHAGQDIAAAEGTPIVAPRGGTISWVGYQAEGAGHYVVLDADGEPYDYAFMHLQSGSTKVRKGQRVATGQRLGNVGNTGRSFGAHLHFEMWRGAWYAGGTAIDPLPSLRAWDTRS